MKLKNRDRNNLHGRSSRSKMGIGSDFLKCVLRSLILLAILPDSNVRMAMVGVQSEEVIGQSYLVPEPTLSVTLISLERGPLLPITNMSNTDVVLTKEPGYFEAYSFDCNATFPVQWTYVGEGAPIMTADVGRGFTDFFDPSTYTYQTSMTMYTLEEQNSGRYVCRGIESQYQKISSYVHLYVPGSNIFVSSMEKKIQVAPYKDQITVPCGVSDPTVQINLYKGNHKGSYKRIETNSSITFNPRKGFRLQRQALQDPFGKYLCVAVANKKRVRVNVVPKIEGGYSRKKRELHSNDIHPVAEALEFSYDNRYHRMLCCSASTIPPKLSFAGCTSIVDCEIKSGCFRENRCESREGNLDNGYYNNYLGLDPPGCTGHSLRDDPNGDFGLFLCSDASHTVLQYQPFLLNRGNLFMSFDVAPPADKIMSLDRATNEELFMGSETMFRCNSSRFFFGSGVRWAFERRNGELEFVENSEAVRDVHPVGTHRRHTVLRIPHVDIKSIVCVAPVWNSPTEWRMLSLPLHISEVFAPSPYPQALQQTRYGPPPTTRGPPEIPSGGYSGRHFHHRLLPTQETSPGITKVIFETTSRSSSKETYRDEANTPSYNNYVDNSHIIPHGSDYVSSSSQYFYTKHSGETGIDRGQISPEAALRFLNSTINISSVL